MKLKHIDPGRDDAGSSLRMLRLRGGMSLAVLAARCGVTPGFLSMVENGQRQLRRSRHIRALASALQVCPRYVEDGVSVAAAAPAGDSTATGGAVMGRVLRRCGVSPHELATRIGVPEAHVEAWMHGDPPLSVMHAVAEACSTDLAAVPVEPDSDPPIHCLRCGRSGNVSIGWASSRAVRH